MHVCVYVFIGTPQCKILIFIYHILSKPKHLPQKRVRKKVLPGYSSEGACGGPSQMGRNGGGFISWDIFRGYWGGDMFPLPGAL